METPLSELETDGENDIKITEVKKTDIIVSDSSTKVDLSKIDYNFIPTSKNTTTRKRSARYSRNNQINDDDLSIVNVPQKKTRRKKAEVSIELSTIDNSTEGE